MMSRLKSQIAAGGAGWKQPLWIAVVLLAALCRPVPAETIPQQKAVTVTAAPDFSSGAHAWASVDPVTGPRVVEYNLNPTISDLTVAANGPYFYVIERYQADNVSKYHIDAPTTRLWQCSTLGTEGDGNPHDMVFAGSSKAYLTRYESTKLWVVNPSAADCAGFKIGEIDLSAFADGDGIPEMDKGIIVGGKLFITLQRMDRNAGWVPQNGYLAVIDIATDTVIDPGIPNPDNVPGIPLNADNPSTIQLLPENGQLYVQCAGRFSPQQLTGGVVKVDPNTYATQTILSSSAINANIFDIAVLSPSKGYLIGYAGWQNNTLYSFNPTTGAVLQSGIAGLAGTNLLGGLKIDKNKMLWAGTVGELVVIDTVGDTQNETLNVDLNPLRTVFCTYVPASFWTGAVDLGGGWRWLNWFGYFNDQENPWIYHDQHRWLYPFGTGTDDLVFYDSAMSAFWSTGQLWWTSRSVYPWIYRFSDGNWLWYQEGTSNPRWFYNAGTGNWEQYY